MTVLDESTFVYAPMIPPIGKMMTSNSVQRKRSIFRLILAIVTLGLAGLIPILRWALWDINYLLANALSFLFAIACASCGWIWLLTLPRIRIWNRLLILSFPFLAYVVFNATFEQVGVTGDVFPNFRLRRIISSKWSRGKTETKSPQEVSPVSSSSDHSIQFMGSNRNGVVESAMFSTDWQTKKPQVLWKRAIGAGWSGFAYRDGFAITLEQVDETESIVAMDIMTGETVWAFSTPGKHSSPLGGLGPRSTPTIDREKVFWQTATGRVLCSSFSDGSLVWEKDLLSVAGWSREDSESELEWGRSGSPLVVDDLVIVPLGGKSDQSARSLVALDRESGEVRWKAGKHQINYTSPVIATIEGIRQIVLITEESVCGYDLTSGESLWHSPWFNDGRSPCASQPVLIDGNRILLSKGYAQGAKLIEISRNNIPSDEVRSTWTTRDIWENTKVLKTKFTSAISHRETLYGLSNGVLECVDPKDGALLWRGKRFGHGQMLVVNDHLLVSAEDGRVVLISTDDKPGSIIAEVQVLEGVTWNMLAVAGPYVLVRNAEQAACLYSPSISPELKVK